MWARVKGQTDEELLDVFQAVCWRPGVIDAGLSDRAPLMYRLFHPCFNMLRPFRNLYVSGEDLAAAMVHGAAAGFRGRIVPNREIRDIAQGCQRMLSATG